MLLKVRVVPRAAKKMVRNENDTWKVYLTKPAHDGLANAQLIELLSEHFDVKKYEIRILKGLKSRVKTVEINADTLKQQ